MLFSILLLLYNLDDVRGNKNQHLNQQWLVKRKINS